MMLLAAAAKKFGIKIFHKKNFAGVDCPSAAKKICLY